MNAKQMNKKKKNKEVHQFDGQTKTFFISNKDHTVKFSSHEWCGIWSDLSIERTLKLYVKSKGGLVGIRLRTIFRSNGCLY